MGDSKKMPVSLSLIPRNNSKSRADGSESMSAINDSYAKIDDTLTRNPGR
jgi:hypothetical protein